MSNLNAVLLTRKPTSIEYQLAVLFLERAKSADRTRTQIATGRLSQSSLSKTIVESMEQKESLGKGSAATVYRAKLLGVEFAKKTFDEPNSPDFEEVSILLGLSHPNVTSLLCYAKGKEDCSIIMELMDEDLFGLMRKRLRGDNTYFSIYHIGSGRHYGSSCRSHVLLAPDEDCSPRFEINEHSCEMCEDIRVGG